MASSSHAMRRGFVLAVVATCALAGAAGAPSSEASGGEPRRVLHVCDCPPAMANEERGELLRALAARGFVQGTTLDLRTLDLGALGGESAAPGFPVPGGRQPSEPYARLLAAQIARSRAQLVLASGVRVAAGAKVGARDTPVLFWRLTDPVGWGLVPSLARPGGHMTGFSRAIEKLTVKRLELLHEMVPGARRIGFVFTDDIPSHVRQAAELRVAAPAIGVRVTEHHLPRARWDEGELDRLFSTMRHEGVEAFLLPDQSGAPTLLVALAARHRLATIHSLTHVVTDWGGLAAYSTAATSIDEVADYAARILRGARPGDLPVQEPTRFELVLNARAARELGIEFPASFLLRASQVVDK
jgi:putative ABC transport system substrate-binding protein